MIGNSQDSLRNFPPKQKMAIEYASQLAIFVKKTKTVSFQLDDLVLSKEMAEIFKKVGFLSDAITSHDITLLRKQITKKLDDGNLVLLQFRPKTTDYNLVNLLRDIKKTAPTVKLDQLVPIFASAATQMKQQKIFQALGAFGIQYAVFLTPNASTEKNMDEILQGIVGYDKLTGLEKALRPQTTTTEAEPAKVKNYKELMEKGDELMAASKYEEAIAYYTKAIELGPTFEALMERGDAYYSQKKYLPALSDYREASKLKKSAPEPYAKISKCYLKVARLAKMAGKPDNAREFYANGVQFLSKADAMVEEMIKENKDTPEYSPPYPYATILGSIAEVDIRNMGFADLDEKMSSIANGILEKTKSRMPNVSNLDVDTRIDLAILMARYGRYDEAEDIFREIIAEEPTSVGPAFNNFAVELRKNEKYDKSFQIYKELLKYDIPDKAIVVENMKTAGIRYAGALKKDNNYARAITVFSDILSYSPSDKEWVLCEAAMLFMEMNDTTKAVSAFGEARKINAGLTQSEKFAPFKQLETLL